MRRQFLFFVGVAFLVLCGGCHSTSGIMVENGRLVVEDPAFATNLKVVRDVVERTQEGFLHAQITVQNMNRRDFKCQYRFEWRDANGFMQQHALTPWRPYVFHGREEAEFDAVSPLQGTADFRLKIRRAD